MKVRELRKLMEKWDDDTEIIFDGPSWTEAPEGAVLKIMLVSPFEEVK